MTRMRLLPWLSGLVVACGGGGDGANGHGLVDAGAASDGAAFPGACRSSNECPASYYCTDLGRCERIPTGSDAGTPPPPEVEYELGEPVSSSRYVYVAMTDQGELVRIDGQTLAVTSTKVGQAPREVKTIPGSDGAVVLDSANGTLTIVRPQGEDDELDILATLTNLNRVDVDPSGRYAVVWFDLSKHVAEGGLTGVGSFQDVTVVALAPGLERAVDLTVGFRPREVRFDRSGGRAFVITQDGVSVIDLGYATTHGPSIVPPIPVADPSAPPDQVEVAIVSTGTYAVVRQLGEAAIRVVDVGGLEPGRTWTVPLASAATDIDLSPDGLRVYAVQRDARRLTILDVPGDVTTPSGIEHVDLTGTAVGSLVVSADGRRALMFTNATADERVTSIRLDQAGYPLATWPLRKPIRTLAISPTGTTAIVSNAKLPGDPMQATTVDDYIDRSYGYTLLDLATGFAKLQITPVDPGSVGYAPDGAKAYVALDGGDDVNAVRALQIVTTQTGVVATRALGSPPSSIGILPGAGEAFAAQRHPLGRVTFVDLATDAVRTVTGFDLNSDIVQ